MSQTAIVSNDFSDVPESFGMSTTLELNYISGQLKEGMRSLGKENGFVMGDPTKVRVIEGFNTRVKDDIYWEKINILAQSIKENGFYKDKPLACIVVRDGDENVVYVVEGHRRLDATLLRMSWMSEEEAQAFRIPMVAKDRETSEVDLVYGMAQGNNAEDFRPYEMAVLVKRLKQVYGQTEEQILTRMAGKISSSYLTNLLIVAGAPRKIAELVLTDKLSVTFAASVMNKYGNKAIEVLEQTEANSKKHGNGKITDRFLPGKRLESALKKEAVDLYKSAKQVAADPGFTGLSEETRAVLEDLLRDLSQHEDEQVAQENTVNEGISAAV